MPSALAGGYETLTQLVVKYDLSYATWLRTLYVWRGARLRKNPRLHLKRVLPW